MCWSAALANRRFYLAYRMLASARAALLPSGGEKAKKNFGWLISSLAFVYVAGTVPAKFQQFDQYVSIR